MKAIRVQGSDVKDREKKSRVNRQRPLRYCNLILAQRLCREAQIWATLEDAHILPLLGLTWGFGPLPALVCPWVENGPLNHYLELNHGRLSMGKRFRIVST